MYVKIHINQYNKICYIFLVSRKDFAIPKSDTGNALYLLVVMHGFLIRWLDDSLICAAILGIWYVLNYMAISSRKKFKSDFLCRIWNSSFMCAQRLSFNHLIKQPWCAEMSNIEQIQ